MADISKIQLPGGSIYNIKDEVARQAAGKGLEIKVVDTLPTASAETMGAIYLVPSADQSKTGNIKDEFITYQPTDSTYAWEKIGTTEIDLSDYAKKGDGVTVNLNHNVSGTAVSAHSITDNGHDHTITGTTTADGTNEASAVSFGSSSVTAVNIATEGSVTPGTASTPTTINTSKFNGGVLPELTTTVANETLTFGWSAGEVASLDTGFYTPGSAGTPTSVTLPTFSAVNNLVNTSNAATAAAQKFTGKASEVTGTAATKVTGISVTNHTVTQGTVSGTATGTIDNPSA